MIRVIHFPGLTALPLYAAAAKGMFQTQGVQVQLRPAENSYQLMTAILKGEFEIGQAAIDNLIAYQEGQAAPELNVERDLIGIMATSSTNLDLIVQPAIRSYAELKGTTLGVDALTTGFAFVLRKMLDQAGLAESDYALSAVGGDRARIAALSAGKISGALLSKDFASQAIALGFHSLGESLDTLKDYVGTSFFTRRSWAEAHRQDLIRFLRAIRNAHAFLLDPDHLADAASILSQNTTGVTFEQSLALVKQLVTGRGGLSRSGSFDLNGLSTVLSLRGRYGVPPRKLGEPSRYIDQSFWAEAV